ncbi:hypothetical protein D3C85_1461350 [compost metagenome]
MESKIWGSYDNIYAGSYILGGDVPPVLARGEIPYGTILAGTKLQVIAVLRGWNGSLGDFLRVKVRVLDGEYEGLLADLPACVPYHPVTRWVVGCELDPNQIVFDSNFVSDCK